MPNLASQLEKHITTDQLRWLKIVSDVALRHDVEAYLVGGSVRDVLLELKVADLDITIEGLTSELAEEVADGLRAEIVAHSQFGTYKLKVQGSVIDLAMTRQEAYEHPGALPTVSPGSIEQDLARRDFSINAMAVSLRKESWGDLLDPQSGQQDLQDGLIRVLHSNSFIDDATRIYRAVRYTGRLNFQLEDETQGLLQENLSYLDTISGDRLRNELERVLQEQRFAKIIAEANRLGVLSSSFSNWHIPESTLKIVKGIQNQLELTDSLIILAILTYSVPPAHHEGLIARFNMSNQWAEVVRDVGTILANADILKGTNLENSELYELLSPLDESAIRGASFVSGEQSVSEKLNLFLNELRDTKTYLRGDDILDFGVPEGPQIGELLHNLLQAKLDGKVLTREDEERFVRQKIEG